MSSQASIANDIKATVSGDFGDAKKKEKKDHGSISDKGKRRALKEKERRDAIKKKKDLRNETTKGVGDGALPPADDKKGKAKKATTEVGSAGQVIIPALPNLFTMLDMSFQCVGNATVNTAFTVIDAPSNIINLFQTSEIILQKKTDAAMNYMSANFPELRPIVNVFWVALDIFDSFFCNTIAAGIMRIRTCEFIIAIGDPRDGILAFARATKQVAMDSLFEIIEAGFCTFLPYFGKFTREDAIYLIIASDELKVRLDKMNVFMEHMVSDLMASIKYVNAFIALKPLEPYYVCTNLRELVRKRMSKGREEFVLDAKRELRLTDAQVLEYEDELMEAETYVVDMERLVSATTTDWFGRYMGSGIRQVALQQFWVETVGKEHVLVTLVDLRIHLCSYLSKNNYLTAESADTFSEHVFTTLKGVQRAQSSSHHIDIFELSRLVRSIPCECEDIVQVLDKLIEIVGTGTIQALPPPVEPDSIVWETDLQEFELLSALEKPGWIHVFGPNKVGKTSRVLMLCHQVKTSRSVLWADLYGVSSWEEGAARVASQLSLRSCCDRDAFLEAYTILLITAGKGTVVVFDNIDVRSKPLQDFLEDLVTCTNKVSNIPALTYVIVTNGIFDTTSPKLSAATFVFKSTFKMDPLPVERASHLVDRMKLSLSMLPTVNPKAIVTAGRGLPGLIYPLISLFPVRSIKKLAKIVESGKKKLTFNKWGYPEGQDEDFSLAVTYVLRDLCNDEVLLAACVQFLQSSLIDDALAWALCLPAFGGDKIRWRIALLGLKESGWLAAVGDLGYELCFLATLAKPKMFSSRLSAASKVTPASQELLYYMYWTETLKTLNADVEKDSAVVLSAINSFYPHINALFLFFKSGARDELSVGVKIAKSLAGKVGLVVSRIFPPSAGIDAVSAYTKLLDVGHGFAYLRAVSDLSRQYRRSKDFKSAIDLLKSGLTDIKNVEGQALDDTISSNNHDIAIALTLLALCLSDSKMTSEAQRISTSAMTQWDKLPLLKATDSDYKELTAAATTNPKENKVMKFFKTSKK